MSKYRLHSIRTGRMSSIHENTSNIPKQDTDMEVSEEKRYSCPKCFKQYDSFPEALSCYNDCYMKENPDLKVKTPNED